MKNIPHDVSIISGDNEEIKTNKYLLSVFSPILKNLLPNPLDTSQIIFLPDFSRLSIVNVLNIINSGFSVIEEISKEVIKEITETAQLLSIEIRELCNDENIPSLVKHSRGTVNIGVHMVENESNKFPRTRRSALNASTDINDESTESVFDALLRIYDDGNGTVETNFNTVERTSIDNGTLMKETEVGVRGTKRKRNDMSKTKYGKYQCQQCDYENSQLCNLRTHVDSKHEGVRYSCDQCDYKATINKDLKRHKEIKHEGVRYPCDKCDYKASTEGNLKLHKESRHQGVCYSCEDCPYKASTPALLKQHIKSNHEGVCYPCDQCDY